MRYDLSNDRNVVSSLLMEVIAWKSAGTSSGRPAADEVLTRSYKRFSATQTHILSFDYISYQNGVLRVPQVRGSKDLSQNKEGCSRKAFTDKCSVKDEQ